MAASRTKIGFVGIGRMGSAMAGRFLAAGDPVYGTSRTREDTQALVEAGMRWRDTPREVVESVDVLITSISDDDALKEIASGVNGVVAGLVPGKTWIEMSTVSPPVSRQIALLARQRGTMMLDAPVSGSVPEARAGTLAIMVGGDEDAYARVEPILYELGTPAYIGGNGQGLAMKLAINISLAVQMLAFDKGLLLAERMGIDPKRALEVMTPSAIGSPLRGGAPASTARGAYFLPAERAT